jgi:hypothetical protein
MRDLPRDLGRSLDLGHLQAVRVGGHSYVNSPSATAHRQTKSQSRYVADPEVFEHSSTPPSCYKACNKS